MKLYYSPLSTYSQKALMAFYEKNVSFDPQLVDLLDEKKREEYRKVYPLGKIPLLIREDGWTIPESTIIIEYLEDNFDTGTRLIPKDAESARRARFFDRMYDLYLNESIVTLLFESWKPEAKRNREAVEKARFRAGVMYDYMDQHLGTGPWNMGEDFTMADCAAAPPLLYAQRVFPFEGRANIRAYWERLSARPSWKRVMAEAEPYLKALPGAAAA
jgi:glutathione S-transferase